MPLFLMPVLVVAMPPQDFGRLALFQALMAFVLVVTGCGLSGSLSRRFPELTVPEQARYVRSLAVVFAAIAAFVSFLALALGPWVAGVMGLPLRLLFLLGPAALSQQTVEICLVRLQMDDRAWSYAGIRLVQASLDAGFSLALVCGLKWGWEGRVLGNACASAAVAILSLAVCAGGDGPRVSKGFMKEALRFGLPLLPHSVAGVSTFWLDRLILTVVLGLGPVGVYSAAFQASGALGVLGTALNLAFVPWLYRCLAAAHSDASGGVSLRIAKVLVLLNTGLLAIGLAVGFGLQFLMWRFAPASYREAAPLVAAMTIGFALNAMYKTVCNLILFKGLTAKLSGVTVITSAASAGLLIILSSRWGLPGAAGSFLLTHAIQFLLTFRVAYRASPLPYRRAFRGLPRS